MEIAHLSRAKEKEREEERSGKEREITDFCLSFRSVRRLDGTRVCSPLNRSKRLPDIGEFAFWSWSKVWRDDSP